MPDHRWLAGSEMEYRRQTAETVALRVLGAPRFRGGMGHYRDAFPDAANYQLVFCVHRSDDGLARVFRVRVSITVSRMERSGRNRMLNRVRYNQPSLLCIVYSSLC